MGRTYGEILKKVKPVFEQYPERFTKFYDRITVLLTELKPGESIVIADNCTPKSYDLFMDVAEMVVIEDVIHRDPNEGILEFSVDRKKIRRTQGFILAKKFSSFSKR